MDRMAHEYKDLQQWHCEQQAGIIKNIFKISGEPEPLISISLSGGSCNPTKKRNPQKICGLPREAVQNLLKAPDISTKTGRRDLAFMILLYSTAARIDEILDMKVGQLHLAGKKPYANVIGKGE